MNLYGKLIISLALVAGISAGLLSVTFKATAPVIAERERDEQQSALKGIFFLQKGELTDSFTIKPLNDDVVALFAKENPDKPAYFAAKGQAIGYNASSPVTLLVGFTGLAADSATLLKGYVENDKLPPQNEIGDYIVGFSVLSSEETPGLGERVKDVRPPYTWLQLVTGNRPPPSLDKATHFQKQFRGFTPTDLKLKKHGGTLDAITASTITSGAVIGAILDARIRLEKALMADNAG